MPTPSTAKWPKPRSEDEFEDIAVDFVRLRWCDPNAQRHGRRGQRQHGVDIVGRPARLTGKTAAAQCKNTDLLTLDDVLAEVELAKTFPGGVAEFYVITTGDRDTKLQADVAEHFRSSPAPFRIEVVFWADVVADISGDDDLVRKHWKGFGDRRSVNRSRPHLDTVDLRIRWDEELRAMEEFYERAWRVQISLARELEGWETPFWATRKRALARAFESCEWWVKTAVLYRLWTEARRDFPTLQRYARPKYETGFRLERAAKKFTEAKGLIAELRECLAAEADLESITVRDRSDATRICEAGASSSSGTYADFASRIQLSSESMAYRLACAAWNYCCDAEPNAQDAAAAELLQSGWVPSVETLLIAGRGASTEFDRLRKTRRAQELKNPLRPIAARNRTTATRRK